MEELIIGSHVSFKKEKQLIGSVLEAINYGANTFMFYTGAPQNTNRYEIDEEITKQAHILMKENNINIKNVVVHAPYIINLANDEKNYEFAINFLRQEIKRTEQLGVTYLVLHPGSHVGLGEKKGIDNIIFALNQCLNNDTNIVICLETMAGKGSECGKTFEEINEIISGVKLKEKVGVCLDTCHINDAGYDITKFDKILDEFDNVIGFDKLKVLHINDSKNTISSHKDRHSNIGFGTIGFDNLIKIIHNPKLKNIPKILETPYIDKIYPPYKFEIEMIRNKKFNNKLKENIIDYYK